MKVEILPALQPCLVPFISTSRLCCVNIEYSAVTVFTWVWPFSFQLYYQVLNFAMIVSSALMIWKGLIVLTGSESPIVVVLR